MRAKLLKAVREAFAGSRKIRVVFKQESCLVLNSLLGMENSKLVSLPLTKIQEYRGVRDMPEKQWNNYWRDTSNRTVVIEFTELFVNNYNSYADWFRDRLYESVASVEVIE